MLIHLAFANLKTWNNGIHHGVRTSICKPTLRDDRGWGGPAPPGVVFHYHTGRGGQYASDILAVFEGTIID